jgi:hypothetical protein
MRYHHIPGIRPADNRSSIAEETDRDSMEGGK